MTETTPFDQQLARLGEAIATDGVARYEAELAALAARARRAHVARAAAEVLADRTAPTVVRERAFAVVSRFLTLAGTFEATGDVAIVPAA
jgi:chorismate mutase